jgi:hypothetical protein
MDGGLEENPRKFILLLSLPMANPWNDPEPHIDVMAPS